jgi:hypothetical protein
MKLSIYYWWDDSSRETEAFGKRKEKPVDEKQ